MKTHRFIGAFDLNQKQIIIGDKELVDQMVRVLKLKEGEQVILGNGTGDEVVGILSKIGKNEVMVEVEKQQKNENEPERNVTLYCAILKKENFEWVVQKATEVGVKEIVPLVTRRTVKLDLRHDRLEKIIKEAAEQSGRGVVPALHEPMEFTKALERGKGEQNLFFDLSGILLDSSFKILDSSNIWIGPEGGWDAEEVAQAKAAGFSIVSLGPLTLRGETAAIIAAYITTWLK